MSYIFNMVNFRLSPLLQDFPYFDICWTRIPVIPSMKQNNYWMSMALETFNIVDFRLSPLLQDFPYFDICWTHIPVIPSMIGGLWLLSWIYSITLLILG